MKKKAIITAIAFYLFIFIALSLIRSRDLESIVVRSLGYGYSSLPLTTSELANNREHQEEPGIIEDIAIPELPEIINNINEINRQDMVATLAVEAVGLYLPIFYGATQTNLLGGAGAIFPNQPMGEGNYVLAGHHMLDSTLLFSPLLEVSIGHWIQLNDGQNIYTYRVFNIEVVHMSQIEILDNTEEAIVTLITCDVSSNDTQFRYVVQGELIGVSELENSHMFIHQSLLQLEATIHQNDYDAYISSYLTFRNRFHQSEITISRGSTVWILQNAALSLAITILGIILYIGIERKYREIKRRNAGRFKDIEEIEEKK